MRLHRYIQICSRVLSACLLALPIHVMPLGGSGICQPMPPRDRGFFTAVADQLERRGYCRFDPLHGTPKTLLRHLAWSLADPEAPLRRWIEDRGFIYSA